MAAYRSILRLQRMRHHPDTFGDYRGFESPDFVPHPDDPDTHCTFGGMGCQYWLPDEDCKHPHWERHYVGADGMCACGTSYPGARNCVVEFNATQEEAIV